MVQFRPQAASRHLRLDVRIGFSRFTATHRLGEEETLPESRVGATSGDLWACGTAGARPRMVLRGLWRVATLGIPETIAEAGTLLDA